MTYATGAPRVQQPVSHWNDYFFGGLVGENELELAEICPQGVARVEVSHTLGNGIVSILTLGTYSPTTIEVWCAAAASGGRRGEGSP
ncbi:MAG: Bor family protein [Deltaproteobacteria bacterium]|nr:Bor family protein [Deltaproteobacteria bacterium]